MKYIDLLELEIIITDYLLEKKQWMKLQVLEEIKKIALSKPYHYEWILGDNARDWSGYLTKNGKINFSQSISDFLRNEFTGEKTPTYNKYYGWYYKTYSDKLDEFISEMVADIVNDTTRKYLQEVGGEYTEEDIISFIVNELEEVLVNNDIYFQLEIESEKFEFFDIGDIIVSELLEEW